MPDANVDVVMALHRLWNTGDVEGVDRVYARDFVAHWPASSEVPTRRGREGARFGIERIRRAFPDWHEEVLDAFGSGDRVATRYVSTGTHLGPYWALLGPGAHRHQDRPRRDFHLPHRKRLGGGAMVHARRTSAPPPTRGG